ncbi:MAG: chemotaxis protein [Proteobacteria bacterium]|nr:chemotaxis protein [Pseudomonadota bacterium]MDE3207380.1 chemotaxis protein CheV [Pseudomonadota bacterium]
MSELFKDIEARSRLAGANKLEILLFNLGIDPHSRRTETFGINVFKVREVMRAPEITRAPEMPPAVVGMVSLRGLLVPVIDLAQYAGMSPESRPEILIVTEYNGNTQGFLVQNVDTILRLEWSSIRLPPEMLGTRLGGLVTAVTELEDGRLVMLLDVEKVLSETSHFDDETLFTGIKPLNLENHCVFFVDDSHVARKQITQTLDALGLRHLSAANGKAGWEKLQKIAQQAERLQQPVSNYIQAILTDIEMPEMDGYVLTKLIKSDPRFSGLPVIMHSSLSSVSNQILGKNIGVDAYVPKFEPHALADTLAALLLGKGQS